MKALHISEVASVHGAGIPMPVPKLNGPSVTKETADFYIKNGPTALGGGVGATIGLIAGAIGGPVGCIIGGMIGAVAGHAVAEAVTPKVTS